MYNPVFIDPPYWQWGFLCQVCLSTLILIGGLWWRELREDYLFYRAVQDTRWKYIVAPLGMLAVLSPFVALMAMPVAALLIEPHTWQGLAALLTGVVAVWWASLAAYSLVVHDMLGRVRR